MTMTQYLRTISFGVLAATLVLTAVTQMSANPELLGLSPVAMRWAALLLGVLSVISQFLPPVIKYGAEKREIETKKSALRARLQNEAAFLVPDIHTPTYRNQGTGVPDQLDRPSLRYPPRSAPPSTSTSENLPQNEKT